MHSPVSVWYFYSSTSNHTALCTPNLTKIKSNNKHTKVQISGGDDIPVSDIGTCLLMPSLSPNKAFLVPQLSTNLLSIGKLVHNNCPVTFPRDGSIIQKQDKEWCLGGRIKVGFYLQWTWDNLKWQFLSFHLFRKNTCLGHPQFNILSLYHIEWRYTII